MGSPNRPRDVTDPWQRPYWHTRAACRGSSPELFFPGKGTNLAQKDAALAVCNTCPVKQQCLDQARGAYGPVERGGIWGGLIDKERRKLPRSERVPIPTNPTPADQPLRLIQGGKAS